MIPVDVAMIQTSLPDSNGFMSMGISVDIAKAATEAASLVIAQINPRMPRVYGDSLINIEEVDYVVAHEEPLLEYDAKISDEIACKIGKYVASIVEDGDTIQVGYGSIPNAVLASLGFDLQMSNSEGVYDIEMYFARK